MVREVKNPNGREVGTQMKMVKYGFLLIIKELTLLIGMFKILKLENTNLFIRRQKIKER